MMLTNRSPNPGVEVSTVGFSASSCTVARTTYAPMVANGSAALSVTVSASPTANVYVNQTVPAAPGEWIGFGFTARYSSGSRWLRARLIFRNDANTDLGTVYGTVYYLHGTNDGGARVVISGLAPAGTTKVLCFLYLYNSNTYATAVAASVYSTDSWTIVGAPSKAEAEAGAAVYFDGDTVDGGGLRYGWDGVAGLSTSYRVETLDEVHPWTRSWWEGLPTAYRDADARQSPEVGGYPLLKWMEGIGSVAGEVREISDALWDGVYTDPGRVPDGAPLRWLAQMLGAPAAQRTKTDLELRQYLIDLVGTGRAAVGTRRAVYEVSKYFLTGDRQVNVVPSATTPHRIVLLVRADEVPGGDLAALAAKVKASGAVPAGHDVLAQAVVSTWDSWSSAAGVSWDEREARVVTWNESDSLGVVIE
ncbi:minor tail protein [Arthrobacter phage Bumble]|uniref:Hydrolase n=1 Tax=Arthrobacter phage Bumble TaxID=2743904 RepID=A0A7G3VBV2_9CAUD|nr:hydrolase [Arthrobacter phage Bumble]